MPHETPKRASANRVARARIASIAELDFEHVGRRPGLFRGTITSIRELWSQRELIWLLARREVKSRYRDSSLGMAWSLFRPLAQLAVYYFAIGQVLGVARSIPNFAVFVFVGLTGWTLHSEIVSNSTKSMIVNSGLVKKVYVPREVFPLAGVGAALFGLLVQLVVLVIAFSLLRDFPPVGGLGYAVVSIALIVVFATALGLLLSALNVYLRDVEHIVEVMLIVLFWGSPIVYSFSFVHDTLNGGLLEQLYLSNPVTLAILGLQQGLWAGSVDSTVSFAPANLSTMLAIALAASLLLLWIAQRVFARLQGNFAQEL